MRCLLILAGLVTGKRAGWSSTENPRELAVDTGTASGLLNLVFTSLYILGDMSLRPICTRFAI